MLPPPDRTGHPVGAPEGWGSSQVAPSAPSRGPWPDAWLPTTGPPVTTCGHLEALLPQALCQGRPATPREHLCGFHSARVVFPGLRYPSSVIRGISTLCSPCSRRLLRAGALRVRAASGDRSPSPAWAWHTSPLAISPWGPGRPGGLLTPCAAHTLLPYFCPPPTPDSELSWAGRGPGPAERWCSQVL